MRVVIAPFNRMNDATLANVRAAGHEVLCTGREAMSYAEIESQYPAGWRPDAFVLWSPEYHPVPRGLDSAPCLKVGVFGDWNLGGQAAQQVGGCFDLLFADLNGCERLRALGCPRVEYAPLWSFDPELHRLMPSVERDLDIALIGNFNHEIQWVRAPWLARVARLSKRYRVCLTSGVHGDAYVHLMNRAKIVFNRSIRGEINMRAYEAAACGSLLFYERENREIGTLFADRQECVLYGEEDLESLLEHYLTHDEERSRIAEAGWRRVQREAPSIHVQQMFGIIEREISANPRRSNAFHRLPETERDLRYVRQWLLVSQPQSLAAAEPILSDAQERGAMPAPTARLKGYLLAQAALCLAGSDRDAARAAALAHWKAAVELDPHSLAGRLNLASMLLETGDSASAEQHLRAAYESLSPDGESSPDPGELYWPCRFNTLGVEYERIEMNMAHGSPRWKSAVSALLHWRICDLLSRTASSGERFAEAERFAAEARGLAPHLASSNALHGRALNALGRLDEAIAAYRRALEINPFLADIRASLAAALMDAERPTDALAMLDDWATIIAGCPPYAHHAEECANLRSAALMQARQNRQPTKRYLAFPDWNRPGEWRALISDFAAQADFQRPLLMLWADESQFEPATLLREIARFLTGEIGLSAAQFPSITLITQNFAPQDRWRLFHAADALFGPSSIPHEFLDAYQSSGIAERCKAAPICSPA